MKGAELLHLIKYLAGADNANTQTTPAERAAISKYSTGMDVAVEIGVYEAVNTAVMGKAMSDKGHIYGIDPFFKGKLGICYSKIVAQTNLKRNKVANKATLIEKFSTDAVDDVPQHIDVIFIDGDHSYEGLTKDWQLYTPKIKPGGYVLLHDTSVPDFDPSRRNLGSVQYFDDVIKHDKRFKHIATVDSLNILQRVV